MLRVYILVAYIVNLRQRDYGEKREGNFNKVSAKIKLNRFFLQLWHFFLVCVRLFFSVADLRWFNNARLFYTCIPVVALNQFLNIFYLYTRSFFFDLNINKICATLAYA